jgi:fibronectin type 3 domain-containing protein
VGEVPVVGETNLSLTDASIEWEQTYYYHVEAVTVLAGDDAADHKKIEIEGDDSAEVKVFAHDVFPPAVPAELQAVFSGPGQSPAIDLVWAPVTDMDLAGYNVYRHEAGGAAEKLNGDPVKTPAYRDANVAAGKSYLYAVSAVDVRGNESARSEEAGETVP